MRVGEAYLGSPEQRAFDMVSAIAVAFVGAPIALVAAEALCAQRRSFDPMFYQYRPDKDSSRMLIPKLKTMTIEDRLGVVETSAAEDPRATKLARFIRRIGVDELPQTALVLLGKLNVVGIRPQAERVLEQRRAIDSSLFDDWYYWYERNPGIFGAGQNHAHEAGHYKENSQLVKELLVLDIESREQASLQSDTGYLAGMPAAIAKLIYIKAQEAAGTRVVE